MTFRFLPALADDGDHGPPLMPSLEVIARAEADAASILLADISQRDMLFQHALLMRDAQGQDALCAALSRRGLSFHEGCRGTVQ